MESFPTTLCQLETRERCASKLNVVLFSSGLLSLWNALECSRHDFPPQLLGRAWLWVACVTVEAHAFHLKKGCFQITSALCGHTRSICCFCFWAAAHVARHACIIYGSFFADALAVFKQTLLFCFAEWDAVTWEGSRALLVAKSERVSDAARNSYSLGQACARQLGLGFSGFRR